MKRHHLITAALVGTVAIPSAIRAQTTTEAASEVRVSMLANVPGADADPGGRIALVAPGFMGGIVAGGVITGRGVSNLVDTAASWTDDQFNGANGRHTIEIIEGASAGWWAEITATLGAVRQLTLDRPVPAGVVVGQGYRIRRMLTIEDVFGPADSTPLQVAQNVSVSDNLVLVTPGTGAQQLVSPISESGETPQWRSMDGNPAGGQGIPPGAAVVVRRRVEGNVVLPFTGFARNALTTVRVLPGQNLLGLATPRAITLSDLGLVTGSPSNGFAAAANFSTGDQLHIVGADGASTTYFYSNVPGHIGWHDSAYRPANTTLIPPGAGLFIVRKSSQPFDWNQPAATGAVVP